MFLDILFQEARVRWEPRPRQGPEEHVGQALRELHARGAARAEEGVTYCTLTSPHDINQNTC